MQENPYFSAEEKKQWIDNIEKHLSNEQEKIIHELNITKVNIKELGHGRKRTKKLTEPNI